MEMEFDKLYKDLMSESWANVIARQTFGKSPLDKKFSVATSITPSASGNTTKSEPVNHEEEMALIRMRNSRRDRNYRPRPKRTYGQTQVRSSTYEPGERY